jgi:hypothetical protein
MIAGRMSEMACLQQGAVYTRGKMAIPPNDTTRYQSSASGLHPYIVRYFLNTSFSVSRWPVSRVPVVDRVICCPSAETTHRSF